ncbi:hypothetical protein J2J97_32305 (plasmid) [Rhizobium bangladeshense]|uniref:hypothetical protein n=1 Tax=Rhizobium bangladeshense TaxID=1138189 RepID=UPI001A98509F|nr:hypothetical protein [Rhizobium bangladeshense]QSY98588.1 hypothetical protein J2J97_32305 [Rhizobium bangladeshense]
MKGYLLGVAVMTVVSLSADWAKYHYQGNGRLKRECAEAHNVYECEIIAVPKAEVRK